MFFGGSNTFLGGDWIPIGILLLFSGFSKKVLPEASLLKPLQCYQARAKSQHTWPFDRCGLAAALAALNGSSFCE